jgi:hypothetical protein
MPRTALLVACLALSAAAAAAKEPEFVVEIRGENGSGLTLSLDSDWVTDLVDEIAPEVLDCDDDPDPNVVEMVRHLDREGENSRYTLRRRDETIFASRRGGRLELFIEERDGERAEIVLPWGFANCLAGKRVTLREAFGALDERDDFLIEVRGRDGSVRVRID